MFRRSWVKNSANLSINLATDFMNCIHDFLPASDMLRIPDSGCVLPLSSSRISVKQIKEMAITGNLTLVW